MGSPSRSPQFKRSLYQPESPGKFIPHETVLDEELINYLNTPTKQKSDSVVIDTMLPLPTKSITTTTTTPVAMTSSSSSISVDNSDHTKGSEYSSYSECSSPDYSPTLIEVQNLDDLNINNSNDLTSQNKLLRDEIERLNNELLVAVHVDETIESEQEGMLSKLDSLRREYEYKLNQQRQQIEHLTQISKKLNSKKKPNNIQVNFEEQNNYLTRQNTDNQKIILLLKEKLQEKDVNNLQLSKKINDLENSIERTRNDLQSSRQELEKHRARAIKTLQEKEKLINELRINNTDGNYENSTSLTMELNQLRQECTLLRSENQSYIEQLKVSKEELINADIKIEETYRKYDNANREIQENLIIERKKRIEAEEDSKQQSDQVRNLKNELTIQLTNYNDKLKNKDIEISKLRSQLSALSTPTSAVEMRLTTLTKTLVSKQIELESLTTEKNALRLQLERIEENYRKVLNNLKKPLNANDTDDVKARLPTFMVESPYDTSVTRRVKRAYSSLDAISVRIGVFLRRYPLARIFIIMYIGLLQFWVLVVLLSRTPDAH